MMASIVKRCIIVLLVIQALGTAAQEIPLKDLKRTWFPAPMDKGWQTSIGIISTTMPREITEEIQFRIPAADIHIVKRLGDRMYLDGRALIQVMQNLVSLGPRWTKPINDRVSMSVGNDVAFWFGTINTAGIKTRGTGWQSYPNLSAGYRFNKGILLTLKAEAIMNFGIKTYAGPTPVTSDYRLFSGSAYTVAIEQAFFGKKGMTLAFRAIYSDYYWQTWTLFEHYDRNLFFPQLIVGLML